MAPSNDGDDVLSRLPRNRPARRSARRAPAASAQAGPSPAEPNSPAPPKPESQNSPAPPKPESQAPAVESASRPVQPPTGGEILQSAVQAVGDLASIGVAVGREVLKAALRRLPRL